VSFAIVIFFINDGKLTENRRKIPSRLKCVEFIRQGDRKTVGKFRRIRNFPSSSSEIVGFTRFSCRKSFPSPLQVSLLHPFRLAEFSVNFFFSVPAKTDAGETYTAAVTVKARKTDAAANTDKDVEADDSENTDEDGKRDAVSNTFQVTETSLDNDVRLATSGTGTLTKSSLLLL
jgi:hypothetical protein